METIQQTDPRDLHLGGHIYHWGPDEWGWAVVHRGPRQGCSQGHEEGQ